MVWMRVDHKHQTRFHRIPTCRQLRKKPALGEPRELIAVELNQVGVRPCATCYPDAPRVKIIKRYCELCNTVYACPHNGGVAVTDRGGRQFWVWPDSNGMPFYRRQDKQLSA